MANEVMVNNLESVRKGMGGKKIYTASDEKPTNRKNTKKGARKLKNKLSKRFRK